MTLDRQDLQTITDRTLGHYYRPAGLPRQHQPWLACVWRKAG